MVAAENAVAGKRTASTDTELLPENDESVHHDLS